MVNIEIFWVTISNHWEDISNLFLSHEHGSKWFTFNPQCSSLHNGILLPYVECWRQWFTTHIIVNAIKLFCTKTRFSARSSINDWNRNNRIIFRRNQRLFWPVSFWENHRIFRFLESNNFIFGRSMPAEWHSENWSDPEVY